MIVRRLVAAFAASLAFGALCAGVSAREKPATARPDDGADVQPADATKPADPPAVKARTALAAQKAAAEKAAAQKAAVVRNLNLGGIRQAPLVGEALEQFRVQVWQQVKGGVLAELHFLDKVCELTEDQRRLVNADAAVIRDDVLAKVAPVLQNQAEFDNPDDPSRDLRNIILHHVEAYLSVEQRTRYRHELDVRSTARRLAHCAVLISKLEQRLYLDAEQRTTLHDRLRKHWKPAWDRSSRVWLTNEPYFPQLGPDVFDGVLNDDQLSLWTQSSKYGDNVRFSGAPSEWRTSGAMQELSWWSPPELKPVDPSKPEAN